MREITANTAFTVTKRELIISGIDLHVEACLAELKHKIGKELISMVMSDLKDVDNNFKFELTIKKLENSEIS